MSIRKLAVPFALVLVALGCGGGPETRAEEQAAISQARATIQTMTARDPSLQSVLDRSYGYVVFPQVGEGGFIVGGARGQGVVFERGRPVGFATLTEGSIGLQAGGQSFSEVIVFEDPGAFQRLKAGNFDLTAEAQAIALTSGASANARFEGGTAVFVLPEGGLMAGVTVGGQQISFEPMV